MKGDASNQLYSQKTETQKICVASQRINIECFMLFYTTIRNCYKENTLYECIAGTCCINKRILSIQVSLACQKHSNQFYPLRGWIVNKISFLFTSNQFHSPFFIFSKALKSVLHCQGLDFQQDFILVYK